MKEEKTAGELLVEFAKEFSDAILKSLELEIKEYALKRRKRG